jgi:CemA family
LLQELVLEFREDNKQALLNVISDTITGILLFVILVSNHEGREVLFRTVGRVFGGLSDTAKAFLIIASTDILLGWVANHKCSEQRDNEGSAVRQVLFGKLDSEIVVIAVQVSLRRGVDSSH